MFADFSEHRFDAFLFKNQLILFYDDFPELRIVRVSARIVSHLCAAHSKRGRGLRLFISFKASAYQAPLCASYLESRRSYSSARSRQSDDPAPSESSSRNLG